MLRDETKISDSISKHFVQNSALLVSEEKREKLWVDCIAKAKILIKSYKDIRLEVVELALKCCVVHHGGKSIAGRYTIKNFAADVGIKPATLFEWIRLHKVAMSLTEKDRKNITFTQLTQISRTCTGIHTSDKRFQQKIRKKLKEVKATHPATVKMRKYLKHMKTIEYNLDNPKLYEGCDPEVLAAILYLSKKFSGLLEKYERVLQ